MIRKRITKNYSKTMMLKNHVKKYDNMKNDTKKMIATERYPNTFNKNHNTKLIKNNNKCIDLKW
jgi:hypothetical protein